MRKKTTPALVALAVSIGATLVGRTLGHDSTLALLSEGYTFIPKRCQRYRSDIFETRLMLTRAICMTGERRPRFSINQIGLPERAHCLKPR